MALIQSGGPGALTGDLAEISQEAFNELARKYETKYIPELAAHAVVVPDALYREKKGNRVYLGDDESDAKSDRATLAEAVRRTRRG